MRDLMGRCWMTITIIGIALAAILIPVVIHAQDLSTNLLKGVSIGGTAIVGKLKLLSKDADANAKQKYGGADLMVASQQGPTKDDERQIHKNDSKSSCMKKKKIEKIIKERWENILHGKKNIGWFILLLLDFLMMPGRIILWIILSIGCWLGI